LQGTFSVGLIAGSYTFTGKTVTYIHRRLAGSVGGMGLKPAITRGRPSFSQDRGRPNVSQNRDRPSFSQDRARG
jgi:hypothetical protein